MSAMTRLCTSYGTSGAIPLDQIKRGTPVPQIERRVNRLQMVLYCASIRFAHQVHFDDELCRSQGWNGVILPGFLLGNWCMEATTRMLGPTSVVKSISFKMASVAYPDRLLRVTGEVAESTFDGGDLTVTCQLAVIDEDDAVLTKATVVARVPIQP